jgi:hypothetical protein
MAGGASATAGTAGVSGIGGAGQQSSVLVDQVVQSTVSKVDLLLMIDNSASMTDKQEILRAAVPALVGRLISPLCVDQTGTPTGANADSNGTCATGAPEFAPRNDIHVGIVSSSVGSHGGASCAAPPPSSGPDNPLNDNARLIGSIRPMGSNTADPTAFFDSASTWNNSGFLAWDPTGIDVPPGASNASAFTKSFADMIHATGQQGCGFEAQLESWYRFLIDPEPPANVTKVANTTVRGSTLKINADGTKTCTGCDQALLAQRKAFLRPDSLVAIVMLSDEDDCSIRDDGVGWFVTSTSLMPKATAACAANPNDSCCRSCAQNESTPPTGCQSLAEDAVCGSVSAPNYATWDALHDSLDLRCYAQKQRFGFDLLYPTDRYIQALTSATLTLQSDGLTVVPNPLYDTTGSASLPRDPSLVFLAGIVGVPWQDLADDASQTGTGLTYLTATELVSKGRWGLLLGDPSASPPVPPSDPFMIKSVAPRSGVNPITNGAIVSAASLNPSASPINGHEKNSPDQSSLQFACTFPLATPKTCAPGDANCECSASSAGDLSAVTAENSPLCQPPGGGAPSNVQSYAKAYPSVRELQVLKDFGANSIVASICPKVTASANPTSDASYGYNPAASAMVERMSQAFKPKCLPRALATDPTTHQISCQMIEARQSGCDCTQPGRGSADPTIVSAVDRQMKASGVCDNPGQPACSSFCACEISQESGADLTACQAGQPASAGFCYVDDPSSPVLASCPTNQKQILRFVSVDAAHPTPSAGALSFIACTGSAVSL